MQRSSSRGRAVLAVAGVLAGLATALASAAPYWPPITDPPTGERHTGRFVWAELLTRDVGAAAEFYGKVFGWTFETYGPADDLKTYTLVLSGGTPIGGMVYASPRKDEQQKRAARWVGLISVPDVKAAASYVEEDGGKVLMPPKVLGQRGTAALFLDPEGGLFGVIDSATGDPGDYLADDNTWLWVELWADDAAKMAAFYKGLAGYEAVEGLARAEAGGIVLRSGGFARAGILPKPAKVPTTWVPYIRVASVSDTVARASAAGARVLMQPARMHGTNVAILADPTGAPFAVAEWAARERGAGQ
ncbi:MAG: VOC family protein [Gammaproteobacteria bacterium]|nr:VOC family protein [Gammaproteobacteria bacterium]